MLSRRRRPCCRRERARDSASSSEELKVETVEWMDGGMAGFVGVKEKRSPFHSSLPLNLSPLSVLQAETPIEEFAPTPAFPALQYLESVDQGGVAWRAGLRTGDFLIEVTTLSAQIISSIIFLKINELHTCLSACLSAQVNGTDVVKVGHRQVVSLIRQGGSQLLMKVVSVSRKSDANLLRKKGTTVCLSVYLPVCLPVYLPVYLSIFLSVSLSFYLSVLLFLVVRCFTS